VDQVSAVEHATVAGVPRLGPDGQPQMTAGGGRPLILTTLQLDEAMRLLAAGRRGSVLGAAVLLVGGLGAVAAGLSAWLVGL
jgi:hypothetical protein